MAVCPPWAVLDTFRHVIDRTELFLKLAKLVSWTPYRWPRRLHVLGGIENALLLTVEAYVDDDGAGRRPLLGTSAPHDLQPLCHNAGTGGKEGRIRGGGGVVVVFRRRRLGCSTRPGATATPG